MRPAWGRKRALFTSRWLRASSRSGAREIKAYGWSVFGRKEQSLRLNLDEPWALNQKSLQPWIPKQRATRGFGEASGIKLAAFEHGLHAGSCLNWPFRAPWKGPYFRELPMCLNLILVLKLCFPSGKTRRPLLTSFGWGKPVPQAWGVIELTKP